MYKNTLKVFTSNFALVWKQLLFNLVFGLLIVGLIWALALPILDLLVKSGWTDTLQNFIETVYTNPRALAEGFKVTATELWFVLKRNTYFVWGSYFGIIFLIFFIANFGFRVSHYCLGELISGRMKALVNYGYTNKLVATLKRSTVYAITTMILSIPFLCLYLLVGYTYGILANNWLSATLLLPLLAVFFIIICATKNAILAGLIPQAVETDKKMFRCFVDGFRELKPLFWKVFGASALLVLSAFCVCIFVGIFTLGAGLIIVLPSLPVAFCIFSFVCHYSAKKTNYYISESKAVKLS